MRNTIGVELHALGRILRKKGVIGTELLDEAAVTRSAAVGNDDAVIGPLLCAAAGEPDCQCPFSFFLSVILSNALKTC
jgi:hypothetical protein